MFLVPKNLAQSASGEGVSFPSTLDQALGASRPFLDLTRANDRSLDCAQGGDFTDP